MSTELDRLRRRIDGLDEDMIRTLASRMEVVKDIGRYKKANGLELRDDERLKALLEAQLGRPAAQDLPEAFVRELYELIHKYALEAEKGA